MTRIYPFLSHRIFNDSPNDLLINFINLRHYLREYVQKTERTGHKLGVYFEYLPSGISIGINDATAYMSASLLKVPLSIGIYRKIQEGRLNFESPLTVDERSIDLRSGPLGQKGAGTRLTVEEAVRLVLVESDNTAKNLLVSQLPLEEMNRVYDYLDIPITPQGFSAVTSPKNYSSIFKSLYLSTYVSNALSNRLLEHLTKANFQRGIRSGVPDTVAVAHKYGIEVAPGAEAATSYTSCGIVFLPNRPYTLCIMTSGFPVDEADGHIAHISRAAYEFTASVKTD
jgi:beta-lactamase class A